MTVQTTYNKNTDQATLGLIYDVNPEDIASYAAEDLIGFGIVVQRGTNKTRQVLAGGTTGQMGIAIRTSKENDYHNPSPALSLAYAIGETVGVLRRGAVWCHYLQTGTEPTAGAAVYYTAAGLLTSVSTSNTLLVGATFESAAVTNTNIAGVKLALVRIS